MLTSYWQHCQFNLIGSEIPFHGEMHVLQDAEDNRRLPTKLSSTCREGYGAPRTRSMPMPAAALAALQRYMASAPHSDAHVKNDHQVAEPPGESQDSSSC